MNRRRMFQTLALAPVGALLSQEEPPKQTPENLAAMEFLRIGNRAHRLLRGDDAVRIRDARVEASQAFATMALFLTPELKRQMEENIRSYECWWPGQDYSKIPGLYRKFGLDVGTDEEIQAMMAPNVEHRESAIALLDAVGIDGILDIYPQLIHPDRFRFEVPKPKPGQNYASSKLQMCGGGMYEDGFFAAAGLFGTSLGVATFLGCLACAPVAVGIGFGLAFLKAARSWSCSGDYK